MTKQERKKFQETLLEMEITLLKMKILLLEKEQRKTVFYWFS